MRYTLKLFFVRLNILILGQQNFHLIGIGNFSPSEKRD